jgi:hypothetical protein
MLTIWLFASLARGADEVDIPRMTAWRGEVAQRVRGAATACMEAHGAGAATFDGRVDAAGVVTLDAKTMAPKTGALVACVRAAGMTVAASPGGRGASFAVRIDPQATGPQVWVGPPRFDPPALDSDEMQRAIAEVIWAGEHAVWSCMPEGAPSFSVSWVWHGSLGTVASVSPVESVSGPQSACVHDVIVRWILPSVEAADGYVVVKHTFEQGQRAPARD